MINWNEIFVATDYDFCSKIIRDRCTPPKNCCLILYKLFTFSIAHGNLVLRSLNSQILEFINVYGLFCNGLNK